MDNNNNELERKLRGGVTRELESGVSQAIDRSAGNVERCYCGNGCMFRNLGMWEC